MYILSHFWKSKKSEHCVSLYGKYWDKEKTFIFHLLFCLRYDWFGCAVSISLGATISRWTEQSDLLLCAHQYLTCHSNSNKSQPAIIVFNTNYLSVCVMAFFVVNDNVYLFVTWCGGVHV